jgi:hypothetical protein
MPLNRLLLPHRENFAALPQQPHFVSQENVVILVLPLFDSSGIDPLKKLYL